MGLDLDADNPGVGNQRNKIDFGSDTTICWGKVKRVDDYPIIRPGGKHVEDVALTRWRLFINRGRYQARHCSKLPIS